MLNSPRVARSSKRSLVSSKKSNLALAVATAMAGLSAFAAQTAHGAVVVWQGTGTDMSATGNWVGGVLPSAATPDVARWNGTQAGNLTLTWTSTSLGGISGNLGISLDVTSAQTGTLLLDSAANTNAMRVNSVTLAGSSGAFTVGDGSATTNLTLGGATNQIHTWTNNSSNTATIASDVKFGMGGGGNHALLFTGSGNWNVAASLTPTNSANLSIQKTGAGTLTLSGGGSIGNASAAGTVVTAYGGSFGATLKEGVTKITAGTYTSGAELVVGGLDTTGTNTQLIMDGGSLTTTNYLSLGRGNGTGTVSSDITLNNSASITVANFSGGYNAAGATSPKGTLTLNNSSTFTNNGATVIAESANSNITFTTNNTSSLISVGDMNIGQGGAGKLTISGTSTVQVGTSNEKWLQMGRAAGGSSTLDVTGGTLKLNTNTDLRFTTLSTANGTNTVNLNSGSILGYTGNNNGVLSINSVIDMNNASTVGTISNTFNLNGGLLGIGSVGSTNTAGNAAFNFNGGTIQAAGSTSGFISMNGANQKVNIKSGGAIIDSNSFNIGITNALQDGTGGGGLTKLGLGALTLSSATGSLYTGTTTVTGGTLLISNTSGSATGTGPVVVASTAGFGGSGTVTGTFTSAGSIIPGGAGTIGTLNFGSSVALSGGTLTLDFNGTNTTAGGTLNDLLNVTGDVSLGAIVLVSPSFSSTPAINSTYMFGQYFGTLTNGSNFAAASRAINLDTSIAGQLNLVYTGASAATLDWASTSSTAWDVVNSLNWTNSVPAADRYYQGDLVAFGNAAGLQTSVVMNAALTPAAVTVNSDASGNNYSFSGAGGIGGTTGLTQSGSSTLTISNINTYSGATAVNGGVLSVNSPSAIGNSSVTNGLTLDNGAKLVTTQSGTWTNGARVITINGGGATIQDNGTGQFFLNIANTLTGSGPLTITTSGGTLVTNGAGNFRVGAAQTGFNGAVTVKDGGSFEYGVSNATAAGTVVNIGTEGELVIPNLTATNLATVNVTGGTNSIIGFANGTAGVLPAAVNLNANAIVAMRDWYSPTTGRGGSITGPISGNGGLSVITSTDNDAATLTLTGSSSYLGNTSIASAVTVMINGTGVLGSGNYAGTISNSGVLTYNSSAPQILSGAISGGGSLSVGFTGAVTLAGSNSYTGPTNIANNATLTISGANSGAGTNVTFTGGGNLVIGNTQALGSNSLINLNGAQTASVTYATDGGDTVYQYSGSSASTLNVILDRATAGSTVTHNLSTPATGGGFGGGTPVPLTVNLTKGGNVSTLATASFDKFNLGGGSGGSTVIAPAAGVAVTIGSVTKSNNNVSQTLVLGGVTTGNEITGAITNGAAVGANSIAVTKSDISTWTLSGTSSYTGATNVNGGKLLVNGALTGTPSVTVSNGILGGTGAIANAVSIIAGTLSPGASIESLSTGSLTMAGGTTFTYEADPMNGNFADLLAANGALSLTNVNLDLTGANLDSPSWAADTKLTVISYNGTPVTSGFSGYADDTSYIFGANEWVVDYNDVAAGANFNSEATATGTSFVTLTLVPEPTSLGLLAVGAMGLLRRRRR